MHLHLKFRNGIEGGNLPWKELWKAWCSTQIQFCFVFFLTGKSVRGQLQSTPSWFSFYHLQEMWIFFGFQRACK